MKTVTIAAAFMLLAACGSSSTGSTSAAQQGATPGAASSNPLGGSVPIYKVTIHLTGAATLDFSLTSSQTVGIGSCSDRAAHGQEPGKAYFSIPAPSFNTTAAFVITIREYTGPGTYDQSHMPGASASVGNTTNFIMVDPPATTMSATVNADGSGNVTFMGAHQLDPSQPTLSGSIAWTCKDS